MHTQKHYHYDYIGHPLNRSTAKVAYSFGNQPRFHTQHVESVHPTTDSHHHQANVNAGYQTKERKQHSVIEKQQKRIGKETKRKDQDIFPVRKELGTILKQMKSIRLVNTADYPSRYNYMTKYQAEREELSKKATQIRQNKEQYRNLQQREKYQLNKQSFSPKKTFSPRKGKTQTMAKQTASGYYPLGLQIHPSGRYTPSQYRNTTARSFGNPTRQKSPTKSHPLESSYTAFSEFGLAKR